MNIPTPHIEAKNKDEIATTVIMPGDPLRAKFIADTYLENYKIFSQVRGISGYTGTYKGKRISVMGSGMGMPSIGIYSYELFAFYDVNNIIRVGSAGSYDPDFKLYDIVLATEAWSESTYAKVQSGVTTDITKPSIELNGKIIDSAKKLNIPVKPARIHSSDVFYSRDLNIYKKVREKHACMAVEMESFSLFANATELGKNAACLLTISDSFITNETTTSAQRQTTFTKMMEVALETA